MTVGVGPGAEDERHDPFDLQRFVRAQEGVHDRAAAELAAGRKTSHWMWFEFPQIAGLGRSAVAVYYAIGGRDEARAYLAHPVLGPRLVALTRVVVATGAATAEAVFGSVDAMKLRSSMTLFAAVADDPGPFHAVLERWWHGQEDAATRALLD